ERDAAELEIARKDHAWFAAALRDFAKVWVNMSPDNQGRFLRALIDKVVVDEDKGTCRVELIDFGAAAGTKEAA
ncbi:MAG TPA: resolvase, partial [Myxococcales bacterium]|nr:resolvase [Myxococcales bacterium]